MEILMKPSVLIAAAAVAAAASLPMPASPKTDAAGDSGIYVPAGTCTKISGGSTNAKQGSL